MTWHDMHACMHYIHTYIPYIHTHTTYVIHIHPLHYTTLTLQHITAPPPSSYKNVSYKKTDSGSANPRIYDFASEQERKLEKHASVRHKKTT